MTNKQEDRPRWDEAKAREVVSKSYGWIPHLLDNGDGTFSVMGHITCERCDYCDESYKEDPDGTKYDLYDRPMVHKFLEDPYAGRAVIEQEAARRFLELSEGEQDGPD